MWLFRGRKSNRSMTPVAQRQMRCGVEMLESRRLLSGTATLEPNHVLYVTGTLLNDNFEVQQTGTDVVVKLNGSPMTINIVNGGSTSAIDTSVNPISRINIHGFTGNDTITFDSTVTEPGIIFEGNGGDQITSSGSDTMDINANGGNDTVTLGDGNHAIGLGGGNDSVTVGNGNNAIGAYGGNDDFTLGNGDNLLGYVGGDVTVTAGTGNNAIYASGGAGSHITVTGGSGNNLIYGGRGDAMIDLSATSGADIVHLGRGHATLLAGSGDDLIFAEGGPDDSINAGTGTDTILTLQGNDTIDASDGVNDEIVFLTTANSVTGNSTDTVWGAAAPNPNNTGIPSGNWISTLPHHWAITLAVWEALTTLV